MIKTCGQVVLGIRKKKSAVCEEKNVLLLFFYFFIFKRRSYISTWLTYVREKCGEM